MEFSIELDVCASMYMEGWDGSATNNYTFNSSEDDLKVLSGVLTYQEPDDDVAELLEEHLPDLFYDIYETAAEVAQYNTIFEGTVEDLLQYLLEWCEIHPIDIIEQDIKKNVFDPGCKDWRLLPDEELIQRWCDQYREKLEHEKYTVISDFFNREFNIYCLFEECIDVQIRLPKELYDEVQKRKSEN